MSYNFRNLHKIKSFRIIFGGCRSVEVPRDGWIHLHPQIRVTLNPEEHLDSPAFATPGLEICDHEQPQNRECLLSTFRNTSNVYLTLQLAPKLYSPSCIVSSTKHSWWQLSPTLGVLRHLWQISPRFSSPARRRWPKVSTFCIDCAAAPATCYLTAQGFAWDRPTGWIWRTSFISDPWCRDPEDKLGVHVYIQMLLVDYQLRNLSSTFYIGITFQTQPKIIFKTHSTKLILKERQRAKMQFTFTVYSLLAIAAGVTAVSSPEDVLSCEISCSTNCVKDGKLGGGICSSSGDCTCFKEYKERAPGSETDCWKSVSTWNGIWKG